MVEMTSRERVLEAIEHREPDRVPVDFGNRNWSIVNARPYGYKALCEYLNISDYPEPKIVYLLNIVANVDERILKKFNVDIRNLGAGGLGMERLPDGTLRDLDNHGIICKPAGPYFSIPDTLAPLRDAISERDIEEYQFWSDYTNPVYFEGKKEEAKYLHEHTDYAISTWVPNIFHRYAFVRGFNNFMMDMRINVGFFRALASRILETSKTFAKEFLGRVGKHIDIVCIGDDMGTQTQPFMSIEDFRKYVKPYWAELNREIKKYTEAKILLHCCGSIYPLINDIIEVGFDVLNPIQPLAYQMEPERLKRDFGDRISFLGGIDIQRLLPFGTPEEVREGVRRVIGILAPGGGYILAPSHNIEPETPPENIVAMYEAAKEFGSYPIIGS